MTTTLYGIPAWDTMKKARGWLDGAGVAYAFHDYKVAGVEPATLRAWAGQVGWEALLNRRGTTFRKLDEADRADIDEAKAIALMAAHPSLIKRPLVAHAGGLLIGFDPATFARAFGAQ